MTRRDDGCETALEVASGDEVEVDLRDAESKGSRLSMDGPHGDRLSVGVGSDIRLLASQAVDEVGVEVAVLDATGVIVSVNPAWERFGHANDGDPDLTGVGVNYLEACEHAGDDPGAQEIAAVIRRALAGELAAAEVVEIACHSPTENRWFDVLISGRVNELGTGVGATVVLTPVTARAVARNAAAATERRVKRDATFGDSAPLNDVPEADGAVAWAMVEASPDALVMADEHGVIELVNRQAEELFGYDRVKLLGKPVEMLLPERFAKVHTAHRTRFRAAPEVRSMGSGFDLRARRSDGTEVPVEVSLSPLHIQGVLRVIAAVRDISDRVMLEADARQIRGGFDSIRDGIYMFAPDTLEFSYVNQGACDQSGYSTTDLLSAMTPLHMAPDFSRTEFEEVLVPLVDGSTPAVHFETTMRRRNGEDFPVEVILDCPPVDGDHPLLVVAVVRDITERIEAEHEALIVRHSVNSVSDAVFVCDENTLEFIHVNQGASDLHGYSREELLGGMTPADLAPDLPPEQLGALLEHLSSSPTEHGGITTKGISKSGDVLDVDVRINWPAPASPTAPRPIVAVVRDISARVEAETAARAADARFRAAFDDGPVPMAIVEVSPTVDRVVRQANQAMADLLGYSIDELIGMSVLDYTHPDDLEVDNQATAEQLDGEQDSFTTRKRHIRADGTTIWVQIYVRVLSREGDRVLTVGNSIDVTAEVRAEQAQSRQTALSETLSQLRLRMLEGASQRDALDLICEATRTALEAQPVLIVTPTGSGTELGIEAWAGLDDDARNALSFATDQGVAGTVFTSGQAQYTDLNDSRILAGNKQIVEQNLIGSILIAPLHGASEIFGVLIVARHGTAEPLSDFDLSTIERFADAAVSAIEVAAIRQTQAEMELFEDRERIGQDMHDKVIGRLFATGMTTQAALVRITDAPIRERLETVVDGIDGAIKDIRTAVYGVRSSTDWGKGTKGRFLTLAADQNDALGFEPRVKFTGPVNDLDVDLVEDALAVVLEAFTNIAKYAQAKAVTLGVTAHPGKLHVTIEDDGVGFEAEPDTESGLTGNGLTNITRRATARSGEATITSNPGAGTTVEWAVPTD